METSRLSMPAPVYHPDIYSDDAIENPYAHYRAIRDLGAAVWLARHGVYALGRYADVVTASRRPDVFSSAAGVAISETTNRVAAGTLISSDAPRHDELRKIVAAPLTLGEVGLLRPHIESAADELVARLTAVGEFDAVTDLAQFLPLNVVSHLVGLPDAGRENMLTWAAATFELFGPDNDRAVSARPVVQQMRDYVSTLASRDKVKPGSWAAALLDHVDQGAIRPEQFYTLLRDYLGPSLDTTIFAIANLIWLFARFPDQWRILRDDPGLTKNAINEAIRYESPIRGFTRLVTTDFQMNDITLPASARVLLLYASANRDERKWEAPETFDIRRKVGDHVGFGIGGHSCAGMHLARLEVESLIKALLPRVSRFEIGKPIRALNNTLRGFASLPVAAIA